MFNRCTYILLFAKLVHACVVPDISFDNTGNYFHGLISSGLMTLFASILSELNFKAFFQKLP